MRPAMLSYIDQVTNLGKCLSDALSLSLGLDLNYMRDKFLSPEPVTIVRCFKYSRPRTFPTASPHGGLVNTQVRLHVQEKITVAFAETAW